MSRIEKEASPIYRGVSKKSREQLNVGDVIYFHADGKAPGAMEAIKIGNDMYFLLRTTKAAPEHYKNIVHVEIVTGIDKEGRALTVGIGRDPSDYPGECARERPLEQAIAARKDSLTGISIASTDDKNFAGQSALAALAFVGKKICYSVTSCVIAALPARPMLPDCTARAPSMMCGELVANAQMLAAEKLAKKNFRIDARIPPGGLKWQHGKLGFRIFETLEVSNGALVSCPPIDPVEQKLDTPRLRR